MDDRLAESFFQPPSRLPTVLGRRLRPFCLWHSFMLGAFAGEESPAVYATLSLAVRICSQPAGVPYTSPRGFDRWREKAVARYLTTRNPQRLREEIETFADYRKVWSAGPRMWTTHSGKPIKCQWQLFIAARLVRYGGMTWDSRAKERYVWATPVGRAHWLSTALAEANGADVNLISDADYRALIAAGHDPAQFA